MMQDWDRAPKGYRELRTSAVIVDLPGLQIFRLSGADHLSWLQGQCTNDVRRLESQVSLDFCLTKPTGQILSICHAWKSEDGMLIATDEPTVLIERVTETVIMEDVTLTRIDDMVCVQGPKSQPCPGALKCDWIGSGGFLLPRTCDLSLPTLSDEAWNLATLECGHPLKGIDFNAKTLPPELGPAFDSQFVSYEKGCYTGQEVLMRIKSRGHTNKTWVGLRSESALVAGASVTHTGNVVGTVHRTALSPVLGHIATATLKNVAAKDGTEIEAAKTVAIVINFPFQF